MFDCIATLPNFDVLTTCSSLGQYTEIRKIIQTTSVKRTSVVTNVFNLNLILAFLHTMYIPHPTPHTRPIAYGPATRT